MSLVDKKMVRKLMAEGKLNSVEDIHEILKEQFGDILQEMLDRCTVPWKPPVCRTIALDGTGVDDLLAAIEEHQTYLRSGPGTQRELERARAELERLLQDALLTRFLKDLGPDRLKQTISRVAAREISPSEALKEWNEP